MKTIRLILLSALFFAAQFSFAQDSAQVFKWTVSSKKISDHTYELSFSTQGNPSWNLYAPNQDLSGVSSASLTLNDSAFHLVDQFKQTGTAKEEASKIINTLWCLHSFPCHTKPHLFLCRYSTLGNFHHIT